MKIKKDDKVKILAGKDQGKTGKILQVYPKRNKVSVEGINLLFKNVRARRQGEKGQKIQFPAALNISNVALVCPKCGKITRVSHKILENNERVRICKKCKEII
ncbi:MAG: 50S ribosomal protein L24 [Candidatus Buchananbacteria bacterium RIFCSPHIGHO2_01_FULL_39_14]|uniref:Large ribosomal subunit protein uL24 n=3 Tax=Candidatus Buchananiibacteriota TaxID=1817903 RepID=A0A1G1XWC9_9BACT|nr:MAG: 50S ribosomal protein L24 [Candidatus Buchananbacteria bacterium RIFCSPHIGHO2_01_FULL_39_14]OGY49328.1 MAG: 50S ribosomal protein L24 [Candidatus Buchananbacteria bacterium RIFCSPHIGHO2_02_FULL_39_17]